MMSMRLRVQTAWGHELGSALAQAAQALSGAKQKSSKAGRKLCLARVHFSCAPRDRGGVTWKSSVL